MELLHRYSNVVLPLRVVRLIQDGGPGQVAERPAGSSGHIHRVSQRLDQTVIDELLQDYRDGMPSPELGQKYGLAKSTVLDLLRQHQVTVRRTPPLTREQVDQVISWYGAGDSLKQIGQRLDRDAETIRQALKRAGVQLRPAGGRRRRGAAA